MEGLLALCPPSSDATRTQTSSTLIMRLALVNKTTGFQQIQATSLGVYEVAPMFAC